MVPQDSVTTSLLDMHPPLHTQSNAECDEYYDELDEHITKKRPNDILIIAADCNAGVGNRQSWAKDHKPAKMCLGNHRNIFD
jgi:hypothetical protein